MSDNPVESSLSRMMTDKDGSVWTVYPDIAPMADLPKDYDGTGWVNSTYGDDIGPSYELVGCRHDITKDPDGPDGSPIRVWILDLYSLLDMGESGTLLNEGGVLFRLDINTADSRWINAPWNEDSSTASEYVKTFDFHRWEDVVSLVTLWIAMRRNVVVGLEPQLRLIGEAVKESQ